MFLICSEKISNSFASDEQSLQFLDNGSSDVRMQCATRVIRSASFFFSFRHSLSLYLCVCFASATNIICFPPFCGNLTYIDNSFIVVFQLYDEHTLHETWGDRITISDALLNHFRCSDNDRHARKLISHSYIHIYGKNHRAFYLNSIWFRFSYFLPIIDSVKNIRLYQFLIIILEIFFLVFKINKFLPF